MKPEEIEKLSDEELKKNLITCDYRGKEVKEFALNALLAREFEKGRNYQSDLDAEYLREESRRF